MKKLLSILSICLVFISCTSTPEEVTKEEVTEEAPIRLLNEVLTRKGKNKYFEGKPFTGVAFDVYSNGELRYEKGYKDSKRNGLSRSWYEENGQLEYEINHKDGELDGLYRNWYENGQLDFEYNYKDGKEDGLCKGWYENGELSYEYNYKDGVEIN